MARLRHEYAYGWSSRRPLARSRDLIGPAAITTTSERPQTVATLSSPRKLERDSVRSGRNRSAKARRSNALLGRARDLVTRRKFQIFRSGVDVGVRHNTGVPAIEAMSAGLNLEDGWEQGFEPDTASRARVYRLKTSQNWGSRQRIYKSRGIRLEKPDARRWPSAQDRPARLLAVNPRWTSVDSWSDEMAETVSGRRGKPARSRYKAKGRRKVQKFEQSVPDGDTVGSSSTDRRARSWDRNPGESFEQRGRRKALERPKWEQT